MSLALLAQSYGAITSGAPCTPATTTLAMKWNAYASEWGAYEITGCNGVNPKLQLTAGTTYTFDQSDATNWYHPVGFAYIAGGAHTQCPAGSGAECPEVGGVSEASGSTSGASTLQYYVDNVAVTSDESGFGLDAYEPEFFNSQGWWGERTNPYQVTLAIPADASYTRLYYFCHIHGGMSAEIEITGSTATTTTVIDAGSLPSGMTEADAIAVYTGIVTADQATIATFDETCGTHNSASFATNAMCASKNFLCGDGATTPFADCLKAIDCQMHHDMAISVPSTTTSRFATFARQMIPHHQNAVAMAKILTKLGAASDYPAAGTEDQDQAWAEGLAREIINVQNFQIQSMQGWLETNAASGPTRTVGTSTMCYADTDISGVSTTAVTASAYAAGTIVSGQVCDKTSSTATTLAMKWNSFSSEWGAYEITGCNGVNPKLQLTAGTTYTFDQSDATNWYHPVGFSYIAGGAHTQCPAGSGAECPELGAEAAGSTLQYYVDNVAVTSDESGFGLDAYEPEFFNSQGWWGERANPYKVTLTIPADASYTKIYYFCHIHGGMSAEIEVVGSSASTTTVIDAAALPSGMTEADALAVFTGIVTADQVVINSADQACGTAGVFAADSHSTCTNAHFLCGAGASGAYEQCLAAIDCKMHHDMAISVPSTTTSKFATFARQMIPHHQNAVSMAKALLKHHTADDYPAAGTEDQDQAWAEGLAHEIINAQNFQIQSMQGWLEANDAGGSVAVCYMAAADNTGLPTGALIGIIAAGAVVAAILLAVVLKMTVFAAKAAPAAGAKSAVGVSESAAA